MDVKFYNTIKIYSDAPQLSFAAGLIQSELNARINGIAEQVESYEDADIVFETVDFDSRDFFNIENVNETLIFKSSGIRGAIYCIGMFLRRIIKKDEGIMLIENICGEYYPSKEIRGHQVGYRPTPNTYDAWTYVDYERYYLDIMYFLFKTQHDVTSSPIPLGNE